MSRETSNNPAWGTLKGSDFRSAMQSGDPQDHGGKWFCLLGKTM